MNASAGAKRARHKSQGSTTGGTPMPGSTGTQIQPASPSTQGAGTLALPSPTTPGTQTTRSQTSGTGATSSAQVAPAPATQAQTATVSARVASASATPPPTASPSPAPAAAGATTANPSPSAAGSNSTATTQPAAAAPAATPPVNTPTPAAGTGGSVSLTPGQTGGTGGSGSSNQPSASEISFNFYDAATLKPLTLPPDTSIIYRRPGGSPATTPLSDLPQELIDASSAAAGSRSTNFFEITLAESYEVECQTHVSQWTGFRAEIGCQVPIPLFLLEEACAIQLRAYDSSFDDFVENAEAFLDGVELRVTAVRTPTPSHRTGVGFRPGTFTATTVQGCLELLGLPLHQLYQLEVNAPPNYIPRSSVPPYLYICCDHRISLEVCFEPCQRQSRSVIFVDKACPGTRVAELCFQAAGETQNTDKNGIWNVPSDMTGLVHLQQPGKAFFPPYIDFNGDDVVSVVTVADQTAALSQMVKTRFLDHEENPFAGRKLVLTHQGRQTQTITDDDGWFYAPEGSTVHALEDEFGFATEPLLIASKSGN